MKFDVSANNIPVSNQIEPKWYCRIQGDMAVAANSFAGVNGFSIAYRVIVIPLTLLSAYLLLSKPRPAKPAGSKT